MSSENQNPNLVSGRQTPISQRRPLQRINFNAVVLSPTKRRKQCHIEEHHFRPEVADPIKARTLREVASLPCFDKTPSRWSSDDREAGSLLLEVFSRLDVKNLVGNAAPACRLWREVAHSKELWTMLRSHLRLVDQLLVTEKVVERRSKGRLFKCKRLGTGEAVLLRMVDLELTNAGKDDGVPTSFLREAALLKKLQHPNVIRHFGSEILGKRAVMCTEFVHESFTTWYKRLETKASSEKLVEIKVNFSQLLKGLSHVHHQGVMHRNLKPDNIFIDPLGVVKLGDFTTTRMLDIPFQAYTPEDPKERDRSGREMRRLWYRAPELILRDEIYGPKVDAWSVGCLLAEAASGRALFQSDSEIDHLFRVFRLVGTPTASTWPEIVTMKNFSPKFPVYSRFDLAQVTRAAWCATAADQDALLAQAQPDRDDILQNLLRVATLFGVEGMYVLDQLVAIPPIHRAGADAILALPFFASSVVDAAGALSPQENAEAQAAAQLAAQLWLRGAPAPGGLGACRLGPQAVQPRSAGAGRHLVDDAPPYAALERLDSDDDGDCPPMSLASTPIPAHMVWSILHSMQRHERGPRCGVSAEGAGRAGTLPRLPPGLDPAQRTVLMDFIIGLASTLSLTDYTLHLSARVVDSYLALHEEPITSEELQVVGATCLKVADVFAEQSKEYYKQENAVEYAEATYHQTTSEQMLLCEKDVLPKLDFDLHLPTTYWFIQCYLAYGRFTPSGNVAKTASFIGDLTLLDYDLLAYPPSLRAQCTMVLAVFLALQVKSQRCPPSPRQTSMSTAAAPRANLAMPAPSAGTPSDSPVVMEDTTASQGVVTGGSSSSGAGGRSNGARGGEGAADGSRLLYLEHWDRHVRDRACRGNAAVDAAMCLQEVVRTFSVLRREWKSLKLSAAEVKHAGLARTLVYPERFPVSKLVRYILPDSQRGLIPE